MWVTGFLCSRCILVRKMNQETESISVEKVIGHAERKGIAEGLRMAAEILRDQPWKIYDDRTNVYKLIIAKAKEVEEGKGDK